MTMQFTINKDFANRYNTYRQKEEFQKLKERYGDVQLKKKKVVDRSANELAGEEAVESSASSSSSDDDDEEDTYSSSAEREHEDFLVLYEALCKNDPKLNDPSKQWFRDPDDHPSQESIQDASENHTEAVDPDPANQFEEPPSENDMNIKKKKKKDRKDKPEVLTLRDYDRQFLLEHGGVEDESVAVEAEKVAKLESDVLLNKLAEPDADASRALFLKEADLALQRTGVKATGATDAQESATAGFLTRRQMDSEEDCHNRRRRKLKVNVNDLHFTDQPESEADAFLRDYIVNQRWRRPSARIPTYSEILRSANVDEVEEATTAVGRNVSESGEASDNLNLSFPDDEILDEDDEFLVRVRDFERSQIGSGVMDDAPVKHRFEEKDKEFIKSYPRNIESSVHQVAATQARSTRAEKRLARRQRKLEEKRAKMAELNRLRLLKLSMYADKIERIKRSCGAGCDLAVTPDNDDFDCMDPGTDDALDVAGMPAGPDSTKRSKTKVAMELAMHLDEDWDPEQHDRLLNQMFNEEYYEIQEDPKEIPKFSDEDEDEDEELADDANDDDDFEDEPRQQDAEDIGVAKPKRRKLGDMNSHESNSTEAVEPVEAEEQQSQKMHRRRRLRGKARLRRALEREKETYDPSIYPDYETYFQKYYHLNCEDVIPGPTPDEDIFCRFKYRQVTPNDFGLSTEEVLMATPGELNSWVPINRVTAYRTEEEEERDKRLFHSNQKLYKKAKVISALNDPNAHWWPSDQTKQKDSATGSRRKRSKRKRKRARLNPEESHTADRPQAQSDSTRAEETHDYRRVNGISISTARLQASGLSVKDLHRARKRKHKSKSDADADTSTTH